MSEDMSDVIQKMSDMIKNDEIPDNVKSMISQFATGFNSDNSSHDDTRSETANTTDGGPEIDLNMMLKMKSIIDSMNKEQNDPRANLLRSLKPYLKPSRKDKVDTYIKIFSMGKMFEAINPLGGEKKNDV